MIPIKMKYSFLLKWNLLGFEMLSAANSSFNSFHAW